METNELWAESHRRLGGVGKYCYIDTCHGICLSEPETLNLLICSKGLRFAHYLRLIPAHFCHVRKN